jgi:hypothetical protein
LFFIIFIYLNIIDNSYFCNISCVFIQTSMTLIYLDLFTTLLFFLFIGYMVRKGIVKNQAAVRPQMQQLNQLLYRNAWLFVLPYFYTITLISDLENFLAIRSFANQILYFFLLVFLQILIFLKIQSLPIWVYVLRLKEYLPQFYRKFFKVNTDKAGIELENNLTDDKRPIRFGIKELGFLLNSFALPLLFLLTNSYFFTKIIFLIFNL